MPPTPALSPPGTPIGSRRAVACAKGTSLRPRASQTRAVGRSTTRPCLSTTRNEIRFAPTPWSDVPGTTATSSPGARQSASSVLPAAGVVAVSLAASSAAAARAASPPPQPENEEHRRRGMQLPTVSQAQGSRSEGRCGS